MGFLLSKYLPSAAQGEGSDIEQLIVLDAIVH